jgi:LPXTG-motif cell wall-anchored protein
MAGGSEEGEATAEATATNAQLGGGDIPSVEELANSLLKNKSTAQGGGASINTESATFMGLLGITILGGISLAVLRRKRLSAATL